MLVRQQSRGHFFSATARNLAHGGLARASQGSIDASSIDAVNGELRHLDVELFEFDLWKYLSN